MLPHSTAHSSWAAFTAETLLRFQYCPTLLYCTQYSWAAFTAETLLRFQYCPTLLYTYSIWAAFTAETLLRFQYRPTLLHTAVGLLLQLRGFHIRGKSSEQLTSIQVT